jgi:hypothetical protein
MLPQNRARVVSCVYGSTFPLQPGKIAQSSPSKTVIVNNLSDVMQLRSKLPIYDNTPTRRAGLRLPFQLFEKAPFGLTRANSVGIAAAAVVGAGMVAAAGWTLMNRSRKHSS